MTVSHFLELVFSIKTSPTFLEKVFSHQSMQNYRKTYEIRTFSAIFWTWNFLGVGEPKCLHSIDCCFLASFSNWRQILGTFRHLGIHFQNFFSSPNRRGNYGKRVYIFSASDIHFSPIRRSDKETPLPDRPSSSMANWPLFLQSNISRSLKKDYGHQGYNAYLRKSVYFLTSSNTGISWCNFSIFTISVDILF